MKYCDRSTSCLAKPNRYFLEWQSRSWKSHQNWRKLLWADEGLSNAAHPGFVHLPMWAAWLVLLRIVTDIIKQFSWYIVYYILNFKNAVVISRNVIRPTVSNTQTESDSSLWNERHTRSHLRQDGRAKTTAKTGLSLSGLALNFLIPERA